MKSKTQRVLDAIHWTAVGLIGILVLILVFAQDSGGGTAAAFATITALSAILWAPALFVLAVWSFTLETQRVRREHLAWWLLAIHPATYILGATLLVLVVIFY